MLTINSNKTEIINTIKLLIYKENPSVLKKIDFDNDTIFLEPLLYAYFNATKEQLFDKALLEEILQGYFLSKEKVSFEHSYNKNGIAYIPETGYFKKGEEKAIDSILKIDAFEIVKEVHPVLERYFVESYRGHVLNKIPEYQSVWKEHYKEVEQAIAVIKEFLPGFYKEFVFANRKIYLHDNPKILNFASIETSGMLYFYVIGTDNLIYYIEELIHQGAHNFLYYVFHDMNAYFKIDVAHGIMRDFTKQEWDYRPVYDAFHGLYTVTKRVECFDVLLSKNVFTGKHKHELLGRLTDQFARFKTGLELLNLDEVYTEKGKAFYKELDTKCAAILSKYAQLIEIFDLSNRDLDFRYDDFCVLNPIEEFYKKEEEGVFDFQLNPI